MFNKSAAIFTAYIAQFIFFNYIYNSTAMFSTKNLMVLLTTITTIGSLNAQIKVTTGGKVSIGYAGTPPSHSQTHFVRNTLFSLSSAGNGAMIKGNNSGTSASTHDYTWYADSTTGIFHPGSNIIGFTTNGTEKLRIASTGNLTITSNYASLTSGSSAALIRASVVYSSASTPDYTWWGNDLTGLFHPVANVIGITINSSEKMRVHSNGFVGIGNTSPAYMLDLGSGDINIGSVNNGYRINGALVLTQRNITSSLFVGNGAGNSTTASNNTAVGYKSLYTNTSATPNNAVGAYALYSNTTGTFNLGFGDSALYSNTTAAGNLAIGSYSMRKTTSGSNNTSVGGKTMYANTSGAGNAAFGWAALTSNTTGANSAAYGYQSLFYNTTGNNNSAIGFKALFNNTTGSDNTALGINTGLTNTTGSYNTFAGEYADAGGNNYQNATALGYGAVVSASNKIRIGNAFVTEIGGQVGWTTLSDSRFKTDIQENVKGLEFIKKLRPVTYKVNTAQLDDYLIQNMPDSIKQMHKAGMDFTASSAIIHSGFIAQEVEQAALQSGYQNTIVSTPSNESDLYGIAYGELVVPLVKAMQEQSAQVDSLLETTHKLDSVNHVLQSQLNDIVNNCCQSALPTGTSGRATNNETLNSTTSNI